MFVQLFSSINFDWIMSHLSITTSDGHLFDSGILTKLKFYYLIVLELFARMLPRTHEVKDCTITIEFGFNKTNGMYFMFTCGRMVKEGKKSKLEAVGPQTKLYTG